MDGIAPAPRRMGNHGLRKQGDPLPGVLQKSDHARWWEDAFSKSSVHQGGLLNMTLVPSHACCPLPYVCLEQPTTISRDPQGNPELVLGRDVLPCLQMLVVLNESGRLWARAYYKKFKTNYLDEKFEQLPAGTVVNVRKGACAVQWDSGNRDFRTDNCFFSYSTGSDGSVHSPFAFTLPLFSYI